jgi:L-2-hydroxyglutarate oxidase LhgO
MRETVEEDEADVVVVGAGVIGLAIGAKCVSSGLRVLVLEGNSNIGQGISARGSNVIHSGIYYPENSLKKQFCISGQSLLYGYCRRRNIGHRTCGKLVVATAPEQIKKLEAVAAQAERNEVASMRWMDATEVRQIEPALNVSAALFVSETGIIDGPAYLASLRDEIEESRGTVLLDHRVSKVSRQKKGFIVEAKTKSGTKCVKCTKLVLAGGLSAHSLARKVEGYDLSGVPAAVYVKGSYFRYSADQPPFRHLVYPVPVKGGLGIHLTLGLSGGVRFGPDVEWLAISHESEIDFSVDPLRSRQFYAAIRQYWPGIQDGSLVPDRAGVRPQLFNPSGGFADFLIQTPKEHSLEGLIALFGIESPGLTSSLAIGNHVAAALAG